MMTDLATWLLTYGIHSTVLIGLVWALSKLIPGRFHQFRESLWKLAIFGGLVTAGLQTAIDANPFGTQLAFDPRPQETREAGVVEPGATLASVEPNAPATTAGITAVASPESLDQPASSGLVENDPILGDDAAPSTTSTSSISSTPSPAVSTVSPAAPSTPSANRATIPAGTSGVSGATAGLLDLGTYVAYAAPFVGILFLIFAIVGVARFVRARRALAQSLADRSHIRTGDLYRRLEDLRMRAGVRSSVALTGSDRLTGPVALDRREICVPTRALTELPADEQRAMLAHELAHIVRRDPSWLTVAGWIEGLFLFQPLNRVARKNLQQEAEYLCDDWAVAHTGEGVNLAKCLAKVASWVEGDSGSRKSGSAAPAPTMAAHGSPLLRRVQRLVDGKAGQRHPVLDIMGVPVGIALLITIGLAAPRIVAKEANRHDHGSDHIACVACYEPSADHAHDVAHVLEHDHHHESAGSHVSPVVHTNTLPEVIYLDESSSGVDNIARFPGVATIGSSGVVMADGHAPRVHDYSRPAFDRYTLYFTNEEDELRIRVNRQEVVSVLLNGFRIPEDRIDFRRGRLAVLDESGDEKYAVYVDLQDFDRDTVREMKRQFDQLEVEPGRNSSALGYGVASVPTAPRALVAPDPPRFGIVGRAPLALDPPAAPMAPTPPASATPPAAPAPRVAPVPEYHYWAPNVYQEQSLRSNPGYEVVPRTEPEPSTEALLQQYRSALRDLERLQQRLQREYEQQTEPQGQQGQQSQQGQQPNESTAPNQGTSRGSVRTAQASSPTSPSFLTAAVALNRRADSKAELLERLAELETMRPQLEHEISRLLARKNERRTNADHLTVERQRELAERRAELEEQLELMEFDHEELRQRAFEQAQRLREDASQRAERLQERLVDRQRVLKDVDRNVIREMNRQVERERNVIRDLERNVQRNLKNGVEGTIQSEILLQEGRELLQLRTNRQGDGRSGRAPE